MEQSLCRHIPSICHEYFNSKTSQISAEEIDQRERPGRGVCVSPYRKLDFFFKYKKNTESRRRKHEAIKVIFSQK